MAFSGTVSTTEFNTLKVVDQAFRRCGIASQKVSSEMQSNALDSLYLLLSDLANPKPPSWCLERQVYPMYQNQPIVTLDTGTVEVLNCNYLTLQELTGTTVSVSLSYTVDFTGSDDGVGTVNTVGIKWSSTSVAITFQTSTDGVTWTTVGTQAAGAVAGEWTWTDITAALAKEYFRFTSATSLSMTEVYLGTSPSEVPMGVLNRDTYVAQSNKVFAGRPTTYWFQRNINQPVLNLWPAPNVAAEHAQLIVWRHRHIMDVGTLQQNIEIPQRWTEAIVAALAVKVGDDTPEVDQNRVMRLEQKAAFSLQRAWDGDGDGSPIFINPGISPYTA